MEISTTTFDIIRFISGWMQYSYYVGISTGTSLNKEGQDRKNILELVRL